MRQTVLRGRERELGAALRAIRETTRSGRSCGIVVVGTRDLGATSTLAEIAEQARRAGCRVAYATASDASGRAVDRHEADDYAAPPFSTLLSALTSGIEPALSHSEFGDLGELYDRPLWLVDRVADLLEPRLRDIPLVIAIDDSSFADSASIFAIRTLGFRLAQLPIVWLLGARQGHTQEILGALASVPSEVMELEALSDEAMAEIARDRDSPGSHRDVRELIVGAAGRPGLLVRLIDELASVGDSRDNAEHGLPPAFLAWLQSRLAWELTPDQYDLMRTMSVLENAPLPVLSRLARRDARDVLPDLRVILEEGYLSEADDGLGFACPLVRGAIYSSLSDAERQLLHRESAQVLSELGRGAHEIAPHLAATAEVGDDETVRVLQSAAASAMADRPDSAAHLLRQARALCFADATIFTEVTAQLIETLVRAHRFELALSEYDVTQQAVRDAGMLAAVAPAMWGSGRREELIAGAAMHLTSSENLDPPTASVLRSIMAAEAAREGALGSPLLSTNVADNAPASAWLARAHGYQAQARGDFAAAAAAFQVSSEVHGGWSLEALEATLDSLDGTSLDLLEEWGGEPQDDGREAVRLIGQARIALVQGRLIDAEAQASAARANGQAEASFRIHSLATSVQAHVAVLEGRVADAQRLLLGHEDTVVGEVDEITVVARALTTAAAQDIDGASRLIDEGLSRWPHVFRRMDNLVIAVRMADFAGNRGLLERAVSLADAGSVSGNPLAGLVATYAAGVLHADQDLIRQASDITRFVHRPVLVAGMAEHIGAMMLRGDNRVGAINVLDRAWDAFHGAGALGSAQRVRRQLVALGVRRRRWGLEPVRPTDGWEALTESERRVALLAAEGLSNREVASRLTVSPNTVATHLRAAYAKLGVSKRVQLARLVLERSADREITESG